MCTKEMQSEKKTSCPKCDTVLLWNHAAESWQCLRCRMDDDFMDTVNQAWEQDKL